MTNEYVGYIYKITNIINRKIYIGQTKNTVKQRWREHCNDAKLNREKGKSRIHNALMKYGIDNFKIDILETIISNSKEDLKKDLSNVEIKWISQLNSRNKNNGYNITAGGEGYIGISGELHWGSGKPKSLEHRMKISNTLKERPNLSWKGKHHSEETKAILSEKHKIPIYRFDLNGILIKEYDSITSAANELGCTITTIQKACKKDAILSQNSIWFYKDKYSDDELKSNLEYLFKRKEYGREKVVQLTNNDMFVNVYESIKQAANAVGIDNSYIAKVCKGYVKDGWKCKTAGGFKWMYYDDYAKMIKSCS